MFAERFARWEITLPADDVVARRRGRVQQRGWTIWYLFGEDEQGEFIDYYASHRMTDDYHVRLYENGSTLDLPAMVSLRLSSPDPKHDRELQQEYEQENARVAKLLDDKGFGLRADDAMSVQVNRLLKTGEISD